MTDEEITRLLAEEGARFGRMLAEAPAKNPDGYWAMVTRTILAKSGLDPNAFDDTDPRAGDADAGTRAERDDDGQDRKR